MKQYDFETFGQKKPGLAKRLFYEIVRFVLVGAFLYVAYLGFTMRNIPAPSGSKTPPPAQSAAPATKSF
jgi:hypothetical protein